MKSILKTIPSTVCSLKLTSSKCRPAFPVRKELPRPGRQQRLFGMTPHRRVGPQPADQPDFQSILDAPPRLVRTGYGRGWGLAFLGKKKTSLLFPFQLSLFMDIISQPPLVPSRYYSTHNRSSCYPYSLTHYSHNRLCNDLSAQSCLSKNMLPKKKKKYLLFTYSKIFKQQSFL